MLASQHRQSKVVCCLMGRQKVARHCRLMPSLLLRLPPVFRLVCRRGFSAFVDGCFVLASSIVSYFCFCVLHHLRCCMLTPAILPRYSIRYARLQQGCGILLPYVIVVSTVRCRFSCCCFMGRRKVTSHCSVFVLFPVFLLTVPWFRPWFRSAAPFLWVLTAFTVRNFFFGSDLHHVHDDGEHPLAAVLLQTQRDAYVRRSQAFGGAGHCISC